MKMVRIQTLWIMVWFSALEPGHCAITATILAGGETDLPADTPSGRLDTVGEFSFVGALAISSGGGNFKGSAVALSREWILTAGHNVDFERRWSARPRLGRDENPRSKKQILQFGRQSSKLHT